MVGRAPPHTHTEFFFPTICVTKKEMFATIREFVSLANQDGSCTLIVGVGLGGHSDRSRCAIMLSYFSVIPANCVLFAPPHAPPQSLFHDCSPYFFNVLVCFHLCSIVDGGDAYTNYQYFAKVKILVAILS